jgi:hypothetical protein
LDTARRVIVTENDHYRSAFHKMMTRPNPILTQEENQAMLRYEEYRAQDEGTTTHGGFAIPVFIDPSVILTDQELDNPFLRLCRTVNVNPNAWKGVSAAGVSWSFDAEGAEVRMTDHVGSPPCRCSPPVASSRTLEVGDEWPVPGRDGPPPRCRLTTCSQQVHNGVGSTTEPDGIHARPATTTETTTPLTVCSATFTKSGRPSAGTPEGKLDDVGRRMNKIRQFGAANVYPRRRSGSRRWRRCSRSRFTNALPDFTGTTGS